jgi:hypothetical protein
MSELSFTRINSNNQTDNASMMVWLWDLGPSKPVAPARPKPPKGQEGDPEYDLAMIEFREAMADYEVALKAHKQAKLDYADFETRYGGPYEFQQWSCDAADTLARDTKRYCISSRTRGYEKLPNKGLPKGMTPGHGQAENMRRAQEAAVDFEALKRSDPVFGNQEARQ